MTTTVLSMSPASQAVEEDAQVVVEVGCALQVVAHLGCVLLALRYPCRVHVGRVIGAVHACCDNLGKEGFTAVLDDCSSLVEQQLVGPVSARHKFFLELALVVEPVKAIGLVGPLDVPQARSIHAYLYRLVSAQRSGKRRVGTVAIVHHHGLVEQRQQNPCHI